MQRFVLGIRLSLLAGLKSVVREKEMGTAPCTLDFKTVSAASVYFQISK